MQTTIHHYKGKTIRQTFNELWRVRSLILTLAKRDISLRYKHTKLGLGWIFVKALVFVLIYTLLLQFVFKVESNRPYPALILTGLLGWTLFASTITQAGKVIVTDSQLIQKIYLPKLVLPIYKSLIALVDFIVVLSMLLLYQLSFGDGLSLPVLSLPLIALFNSAIGLGVALWVNVLSLSLRDIHLFLEQLLQLSMWLTPVLYPASLVPVKYGFALYLNPMAGIIAFYRWALLGNPFPNFEYFYGIGLFVIIFVLGIFAFSKAERYMSDMI
ncbi:MAG: lipopolysaccharide transport system permease protein [Arenicella sp.]|jgi:lipopolysaccharide transport system permease protein